MPRECLKIFESKSKVRQSRANAVISKVSTSSSTSAISSDVAELKDLVRALLLDKKNQSSAPVSSSTPAPVKAVEPNCVTCCGGNFNKGQLHRPQVNQPPAYQALTYQAPIPQTQSVSQTDFESYVKANDAVLRNMQNQGQNVQNQLANLTDMLSKFMSSNIASSSGSGTLPSNTITKPKEELKGITTRSGIAYQGPTIPTPSKVVKQGTEVTKDQVQTPSSQRMDECLALANLGSSINLMPLFVWEALLLLKLTPSCMTLELADRLTGQCLIDVYKGELTLRIENEAITYNLDQTVRDSDFLLFEEADAFLGLEDYPNLPKINPFYYDPEGDILLLEAILNSKPL
nr:reverse transcriptase domain-containing protein [Tanacetum cinerariifolium]